MLYFTKKQTSFQSLTILKLESLFDEKTLEQMKACTRAEFPLCLSESLLKVFGNQGKESLNKIILDKTVEKLSISSPKDVWNLYNEYLEITARRLGIDVAQVIRFESLNEMESMCCTACPLYEKRRKPDAREAVTNETVTEKSR